MKVQFIRNATLLISSGNKYILLDPMLAKKGALPSFAFFKHNAKRNPTVSLPDPLDLENVTHALITHCKYGHMDHLDRAGKAFLRDHKVPTFCRQPDVRYLSKRGVMVSGLEIGRRQTFLDGYITPIPAKHGHGWISALMGPGVGYFIELPNEPSLYIAGDTVLTDHVRNTLTDLRPDIAVVAAGNASMDFGKPILMSLAEVLEFIELAPGQVVANHLEALNHCPVSRLQVQQAAKINGLSHKLSIPHDGEIINFARANL